MYIKWIWVLLNAFEYYIKCIWVLNVNECCILEKQHGCTHKRSFRKEGFIWYRIQGCAVERACLKMISSVQFYVEESEKRNNVSIFTSAIISLNEECMHDWSPKKLTWARILIKICPLIMCIFDAKNIDIGKFPRSYWLYQ